MRTFWVKVIVSRVIITPISKTKNNQWLDPSIETIITCLEKQKATTASAALHILERKHMADNPCHWKVYCEPMSASEVKEFQASQLDLETIKFK